MNKQSFIKNSKQLLKNLQNTTGELLFFDAPYSSTSLVTAVVVVTIVAAAVTL